MKVLIYIILFINIFNIIYSLHVSIPFKRIYDKNIKDLSSFVYENRLNNLMISIYLGDPSQKLDVVLRHKNSHFYIVASDAEKQHYTIKGFDYSRSGTQIDTIESLQLFGEYEEAFHSYDTILLDNKKYNIYFYLVKALTPSSILGNFDGNVGLALSPSNGPNDSENNFVKDLHSFGATSKKIFSINYTNYEEGNLIVGDYLHNIDPKYNNSGYKEIKVISDKDSLFWGFPGDKIKIGSDVFENPRNIQIEVESNYILGTPYLRNSLEKQFFDKYIDKNQTNETLKTDKCSIIERMNMINYVCDKEGVNYNEFPNLEITVNELNFTLNFTKDDLFIEWNGKMICLYTFYNFRVAEITPWRMGSILLRKYPILFDYEKKVLGFTIGKKEIIPPEKEKEKENEKKGKNGKSVGLIIALIIVILISIFVVLFSIRYVLKVKGRRKRATELDDEGFEYQELGRKIPVI